MCVHVFAIVAAVAISDAMFDCAERRATGSDDCVMAHSARMVVALRPCDWDSA